MRQKAICACELGRQQMYAHHMTSIAPFDLRKALIRSISGGTLVYLAGALLGVMVGIQLARGLGIGGYGTYGSAMAVASLGSAAASGGLNMLATRETAAFRARSDLVGVRRLLTWSLRHIVIFLVPMSSLAAVALWALIGVNLTTAIAGGVLVWFLAIVSFFGGVLRGLGTMILGMALDAAIRPMAYSALLFAFTLFAVTLTPASALVLASIAITVALVPALPQLFALLSTPIRSGADDEAGRWFRATMTMRLGAILRIVEATVPLILVSALANMSEAGSFRLAITLTTLGGLMHSVVHVAVQPLLAHLNAGSENERMRRVTAVSTLIMVLPALALFLLSIKFGSWAIDLVFGSDFVLAAAPTSILLTSTVIMAFGGVSQILLQTRHAERAVNVAIGLSLVVTLPLTLALSPSFGAFGAAIAVALGVTVRTVTMSVQCYRQIGIDPSIVGAVSFLWPQSPKSGGSE